VKPIVAVRAFHRGQARGWQRGRFSDGWTPQWPGETSVAPLDWV